MSEQENFLIENLFGGNKGYPWLKSFLGLLQSIRYRTPYKVSVNLLMIQNKLKLLTILSNLLATHLSNLDRNLTFTFVNSLLELLNSGKDHRETIYHGIKGKINDSSVSDTLTFGMNLLLELTYVYIV